MSAVNAKPRTTATTIERGATSADAHTERHTHTHSVSQSGPGQGKSPRLTPQCRLISNRQRASNSNNNNSSGTVSNEKKKNNNGNNNNASTVHSQKRFTRAFMDLGWKERTKGGEAFQSKKDAPLFVR